MNTDLVPVVSGSLAGKPALLVPARDLHAFLEVGKDFSTWLKARIEEYGFVEGQDFVIDSPKLGNQSGRGGNRRQRDYRIALDMAKELAMVERTDKGRQVRRYFIECEQRLQRVTPGETTPPATLTADQPPANGARVLVVFEGGAVKQTLPVADDATLLSPAHLEEWWRDGGCQARPDLALVRVADLERLEGALGALRGDIPPATPKARPARARDPETEAWLRKIDAVVPGKPDMSFIRDAAQGRTREARQTSTVATVLAELLASARAGRLVGLAAFASYRDTTYDIIVSHDTAWDPLRTLGGIAELQEETQRVAARDRRD